MSYQFSTISYSIPTVVHQIKRIFVSSQGQRRTADKLRRQLFGCHQGDHLTELNALTAYERQANTCSPSELRSWCRDTGLNARGLAHALTLRDRVGAVFRRLKLPWVKAEPEGNPDPIIRALVRGYFHQVGCLAFVLAHNQPPRTSLLVVGFPYVLCGQS